MDQIVPARLIRRFKAGNPDRRENLQCICGTCHGCKLQGGDYKLCMGDKLGYLEILRTQILTWCASSGPWHCMAVVPH